jgi:hypothetical protein
MTTAAGPVPELIAADRWIGVTDPQADPPFIVRCREPILAPADTAGYDDCLRITWVYPDGGTGALPTPEASAAMERFESRLVAALEHDARAVLTAVLTFDGDRQWVFYTGDVRGCLRRINAMPQEAERYPIELDTFEDDGWEYLRDKIVKDRLEP